MTMMMLLTAIHPVASSSPIVLDKHLLIAINCNFFPPGKRARSKAK
jgi:hypothetical protein